MSLWSSLKEKPWLLAAVGAVGLSLGVGCYLAWSEKDPETPEEKQIALIKKTIQENGGHLTKRSVYQIEGLTAMLALAQYKEAYRMSKTKRRQPGITDAEYEEIVKNIGLFADEILRQKLLFALDALGISAQEYHTAISQCISEQPEFEDLSLRVLEKLRIKPAEDSQEGENTTPAPKLSVEEVRELLRFQVIIWSQIKLEVKDPEYASIVKQAKLADLTVEKFHIEEENLTSDELVKLDEECILLSKKLQEMISKDDPRNQGLEEAQEDGQTF